jgi:DNA-binding NtrC family response regulator
VAQAIHTLSARIGALVAVNVCAISDSMFEDAIFGHVRGAFTGAVQDAPGFLAEADRGTLFLDEISGLRLDAQAKLLRVLETRSFRPVGGRRDSRSDFRLVAATNEDLGALARAGRFREDLAYRLRGFVIRVPALAERREDIPLLAQHFLAAERGRTVAFDSAALAVLTRHEWQGNVRELRHVVEVLALTGHGSIIRPEHVVGVLQEHALSAGPLQRRSFQERRLIEVLEQTNWNITAAARALGVDRKTVHRRLKRFSLHVPCERRKHWREIPNGDGTSWDAPIGAMPASSDPCPDVVSG